MSNEQIYKRFIEEQFPGWSKGDILKELDRAHILLNKTKVYRDFICENFAGKSKEAILVELNKAQKAMLSK